MDIAQHNSMAWDAEVASGKSPWAQPVSEEAIARAREGQFSIILTPNKAVPRDWFPEDFRNLDVLCLASGGGQQVPILSALGARVTSFDNSEKQLGQDRFVAERERLEIKTVQGDAKDLSCFSDGSFDLVWHPISNVFMPNIEPVWKEAFRVLRKEGVLLAGFYNPLFFIFDREKSERGGKLEVRYSLPFSDTVDLPKDQLQKFLDNNEPLEFGHTLEQQIGGQLKAGFVIADLFEDDWSDEATPLNEFTPTFIATRAVKL